MAQLCNPLALKLEQPDGMSSIPGRTPPLERHDKGSRTRLGLPICAIPALGAEKRKFTFAITQRFLR